MINLPVGYRVEAQDLKRCIIALEGWESRAERYLIETDADLDSFLAHPLFSNCNGVPTIIRNPWSRLISQGHRLAVSDRTASGYPSYCMITPNMYFERVIENKDMNRELMKKMGLTMYMGKPMPLAKTLPKEEEFSKAVDSLSMLMNQELLEELVDFSEKEEIPNGTVCKFWNKGSQEFVIGKYSGRIYTGHHVTTTNVLYNHCKTLSKEDLKELFDTYED